MFSICTAKKITSFAYLITALTVTFLPTNAAAQTIYLDGEPTSSEINKFGLNAPYAAKHKPFAYPSQLGRLGVNKDGKVSISSSIIYQDKWILSVGVIFDAKYSNVAPQPAPNNDVISLGNQIVWATVGLDIGYLINIGEPDVKEFGGDTTNLQIEIGAGLYRRKHADIVRSNLTGLLYEQSSTIKILPSFNTSVHYKFNRNIGVTAGYHLLRGPELGIRFKF